MPPEKVRALPGVAAVAHFKLIAVWRKHGIRQLFPEGVDTADARNGSLLNFVAVGPGYFSAAGIPLLRGRDA